MSVTKQFLLDFAKSITLAQCGQTQMNPKQVTDYFANTLEGLTQTISKFEPIDGLEPVVVESHQPALIASPLVTGQPVAAEPDAITTQSKKTRGAAKKEQAEQKTVDPQVVQASLTGDPNSVECLICHAKMSMLTQRHFKSHDMTVEEYREQFGISKKTPLVATALREKRADKMKTMKLWESRKK